MINVNQITAQLAKMPDQMLQKFAAMHKNDPYTVALALSESNRRKEIRAGSQAQMAGQQQPKVVDQEVAQMMPEEVGIAQLPAKNIEGMATGGIVAFEEGGEVPRFQDRGLVYGPYGYGNTGASQKQLTPQQLAEAQRLREMGLIDLLKEKFGPAWEALTTPPANKTKQEVYQSGTDIGGPGSSPANMGAPVMGQTVNFENPQTGAQSGAPTTPAAPATPVAGAGIPSLKGYKKELEEAINKNALTKEQFQQGFAAIDKPLLEKMQASIDKETSRLKSDKEQDFYMSLIQGGLAAAAESGPNALQNIAKGLSTGAGSYKEALKDFRKATQENSRAEMEMAKYKATGEKDALKSFNDAQSKRDDRYAAGLTSLMAQEMQSKAQIAAAGMPSGTERLIGRIGTDPKFAAAYEKYAAMGPETRGAAALAAKYTPQQLAMLEAGSPEDKLLAQQIRMYQSQLLMPQVMNQPSGNVRP